MKEIMLIFDTTIPTMMVEGRKRASECVPSLITDDMMEYVDDEVMMERRNEKRR